MNRTKIGIVSTIVVVVEALILGILTMARTRCILHGYGSDINGVIQLANQLTAYMLLFESGMTAAYQYNLYDPLINKNSKRVSGLFNGMIYDFRIIAIKMLICVLGVSLIYSIILQNRGVTYAEAISLLSIMGIRLVVPYVFTVPLRTMLILKERKYVTDIIEASKNAVALIIEIILIKYTKIPLFIILSIQVVLCCLSRFVYAYLVRLYYGDTLNNKVIIDRSPRSMTSDILVHRISGLINSNTDSVLLSLFRELGLSSVTIYTSFSTIISYPITLASRIVDSMRATLALKINVDISEAYSYFKEVLSFSKLCVLVVVPVFISQANDFVILWIGKEYTINLVNTILFGMTAIHQMMVPTVYATRDAFGLYKESKRYSLIQAIVNMSLSLLLIKPLGITGVLIGTVVSDWLVIEPCNIRLIFRKVFFRRFDMMIDYILLFVFLSVESYMCLLLNGCILQEASGWIAFIGRSIIVGAINCALSMGLLYISDSGFKKLIRRFIPHISG